MSRHPQVMQNEVSDQAIGRPPYQLFAIDCRAELSPQQQLETARLHQQLAHAETLGLERQVSVIQEDIDAIERAGRIEAAPLSHAETVIWRAWLPTTYSDAHIEGHHSLAEYRFDRIPLPVLETWRRHKESGCFQRFEIWTPKLPRQPDPILVGVNGNAIHLLARWGESSEDLISFDSIKRELLRRWYRDERFAAESLDDHSAKMARDNLAHDQGMFTLIFFFVCLCIAIPIFKGTLVDHGMVSSQELAGFIVVAMIGVAAAAYGRYRQVYRKLTNRLLETNTLTRAIKEDDAAQRIVYPGAV